MANLPSSPLDDLALLAGSVCLGELDQPVFGEENATTIM